MTHDEAFLRDIIAHPDDDAPRLIYADWLEEHGRPGRARYIRTACERARLPAWEARWAELFDLGEDSAPEDKGAPDLSGLPGLSWSAFAFRRGFAAKVRSSGANSVHAGGALRTFLRHAEALYQLAPVEEVEVGQLVDDMADLAASPWLGRLRGLDLHLSRLGAEAIRLLAESPHAPRLTELHCSFAGLDLSGVEALTASPLLARLTTLDLSHNDHLGGAAARTLAAAPSPTRLRVLNLARTDLALDALAALASSPVLRTVTDLCLGGNRFFGAGCVDVLLGSPHLTSLARLDLSGVGLTAAQVKAWAAAPGLPGLRSLSLAKNRLGPVSVRALTGSALAARLKELDLSDNPLGDNGTRALAESPNLRGLTVLRLNKTQMGDAGADALVRSPNLPNLVSIAFAFNHYGRAAQKALADRFGKACTFRHPDA
jgi:uncharacterized protein (TIGR02996 family)